MLRSLGLPVLVALTLSVSAGAQTIYGYEWVFQGGPNNLIDSNAESCDRSTFSSATGVWSAPGQGCYNRAGALCSSDPNHICDLQVVPAGRCTYGDLSATGGPGGTDTCVWPHGAGHCAGNANVGCLTDAYIADATNVASGPSAMCAGTGNASCDMTPAPTGTFRTACSCAGADPNSAVANEIAVCGAAPNGVCSDGDPDRDTGGYGWAIGAEVNLGPGQIAQASLGPSVNGTNQPSTSPRYPLEAPPSSPAPQRDPGSIARSFAGGAIVPVRTRTALQWTELDSFLEVERFTSLGRSFWADWSNPSAAEAWVPFTLHAVPFACDPPVGWKLSDKIDPTPASPNSGDEGYCSQLSRDSVSILWRRDLTATEHANRPGCPPTCGKDFDLTTTETEAIRDASLLDTNAALQLAIQSGEGRLAGANDSITALPLTLMVWLGQTDMRCKMGGWGDTKVGRCSDGPALCRPGDPSLGDSLCTGLGQGNLCAACGAPFDNSNPDTTNGLPNAKGLPPGYDTQGLPFLQLDTAHRIGGIATANAVTKIRLFLVGTSGYAAADFRDDSILPLDLSDMGPVDPSGPSFAPGIGTGGTFTNGSTLPIHLGCCANGGNVIWGPAEVGAPVLGSHFLRVFDSGPGPDGAPACIGDNAYTGSPAGVGGCDQRLGKGNPGAKSDPLYATGQDDQATQYTVGSSGLIPAASARYLARWPVPSSTALSPAAAHPAFNQVHALAVRDQTVFNSANTDLLLKLNISYCPSLDGTSRRCPLQDSDFDEIPDSSDNCPTIANVDQRDADGDGVGDLCDNCIFVANPRVAADFLTNNPWATLTGGQRDDDHDGYGNKCDADFTPAGENVGLGDLQQFNASFGKSRILDTCGTGTLSGKPCAIFDLDEGPALNIGLADRQRFNALFGLPAGARSPAGKGKCAMCPLECTAGSAGSCL